LIDANDYKSRMSRIGEEGLEFSTSELNESAIEPKKLICKLCEDDIHRDKHSWLEIRKIIEVNDTKDDLAKHFKKHHPSILFCCYHCNRSFNNQNVLYTHLAIIHGALQPDTTKIALFNCNIPKSEQDKLGYLGTILGTESERPKLDKLIGKRSKSGGFNRNLALAKPLEIEEKRRKNKIAKSLLGKKLKPLPKGKIKCCVPGCDSHNNKIPKPSFYRFPARNLEQCKLWIEAINKKNPDGSDWQLKKNHSRTGHTRICSKHFVNGVKSHSRNHVDYIPTLYLPDENGKVVNSEPVEDASNDFSDAEEVDGPVTPFNEELNESPVNHRIERNAPKVPAQRTPNFEDWLAKNGLLSKSSLQSSNKTLGNYSEESRKNDSSVQCDINSKETEGFLFECVFYNMDIDGTLVNDKGTMIKSTRYPSI